MALVEKQVPYEFLARWDQNGKCYGAHVQFATVITDDVTGEIKLQTPGKVMPVDVGAGQGFPIADILDQIHVDSIAQAEAATAAQAVADKSAAEAVAKEAAIQTALDSALSTLSAAKAANTPPV